EGAVELSQRAVDPRMTAEAVIDLLKMSPEREGIELSSDIPPGTPFLWADPNRLLQILLNLVYEALQEPGIARIVIGACQIEQADAIWLTVARTRRDDAGETDIGSVEAARHE